MGINDAKIILDADKNNKRLSGSTYLHCSSGMNEQKLICTLIGQC